MSLLGGVATYKPAKLPPTLCDRAQGQHIKPHLALARECVAHDQSPDPSSCCAVSQSQAALPAAGSARGAAHPAPHGHARARWGLEAKVASAGQAVTARGWRAPSWCGKEGVVIHTASAAAQLRRMLAKQGKGG
jgi:hypothetical protein